MSELDFNRTLPPIMPNHGQWFNDRVTELVEQAQGDETKLAEVLIKVPMNEKSTSGIEFFEYAKVEGVQ